MDRKKWMYDMLDLWYGLLDGAAAKVLEVQQFRVQASRVFLLLLC